MFGSSILDVAVGMIFVYLFLSLICTSINEAIASFFNTRGRNLLEGVKNLLNDQNFSGLAKAVYDHGLVTSLSRNASDPGKDNILPSYIPSKTFALSMIDILGSRADAAGKLDAALTAFSADASPENQQRVDAARAAVDASKTIAQGGSAFLAQHPDPLGELEKAIGGLKEGHTRDSLLVLVQKTRREATREAATVGAAAASAEHNLEKFQANVETWFNDSMDRTAGWYKRWSQKVVLAIAALLVILGNADSFMLARRFMRDSALRASLVTVAQKVAPPAAVAPAPAPPAAGAPSTLDSKEIIDVARTLDLPLGWNWDDRKPLTGAPGVTAELSKLNAVPQWDDPAGWFVKLAGLLISIFAVSMGAPFWFDTLSKVMSLRSSGAPPAGPPPAAPKKTA